MSNGWRSLLDLPQRRQFVAWLVQVLAVGLTLGLLRTVVPALAETEFGVARGSFLLIAAFVVAFGLVKGPINWVAGGWSERFGARRVLLLGWLCAWPIPFLVGWAHRWSDVVVATVLLGIHQGLTWSVTQTAQLDLSRPSQRGLVIGLNEFAGYVGVALGGLATGYLAVQFGPREAVLGFGLSVIALATLLAAVGIAAGSAGGGRRRSAAPAGLFARMSWRDRRLAALCQAGAIEKFVDVLVWVFWPLYLHRAGVSLPGIGWIAGLYGLSWGGAQLLTGRLSDRFGRHRLNVGGMGVCALGVALMPMGSGTAWWSAAAVITGLGMAMLYPNLSAAVADLADPTWRASAIGIYRFWRDLGYGVGALVLGAVAAVGGDPVAAFWLVAAAMVLSGAVLAYWGEETHPGLIRSPM